MAKKQKKLTPEVLETYRKGKRFDYEKLIKDYDMRLIPLDEAMKIHRRNQRIRSAGKTLKYIAIAYAALMLLGLLRGIFYLVTKH